MPVCLATSGTIQKPVFLGSCDVCEAVRGEIRHSTQASLALAGPEITLIGGWVDFILRGAVDGWKLPGIGTCVLRRLSRYG